MYKLIFYAGLVLYDVWKLLETRHDLFIFIDIFLILLCPVFFGTNLLFDTNLLRLELSFKFCVRIECLNTLITDMLSFALAEHDIPNTKIDEICNKKK